MRKHCRFISFLIFIVLVLNFTYVQAGGEKPANIYLGIEEAETMLKNMSFRDVEMKGSNYWARNAIYDMASLSVIKGYGEKTFMTGAPVTRSQALALIYRAIGKEEDAGRAAELIERLRTQEERRINAVEVWADGYFQLAVNDGLITQAQFQDVLVFVQEALDPAYNFIKTAPAERQEVGEWIAKAFGLAPIYDQQAIFNSFRDWQQADPLKVPYLEAVLREKIMNGNEEGYLFPKHGITREEMAQVLKNAERFILRYQGLEEKYGYIEEINNNAEHMMNNALYTTIIKVRNANGTLDHILTQEKGEVGESRNEINNGSYMPTYREVVVLGIRAPGNSSTLSMGDEIRYIVDANNNVRFIRIMQAKQQQMKQTGDIVAVDYKMNTITIDQRQDGMVTYQVSYNAPVVINGKQSSFENLLSKAPVELTLQNYLVVKVEVKAKEGAVDQSEVTGIVEDINPALGYISLYEETGKKSFNLLRIYNFVNPSLVEVVRNGTPAAIKDIQRGDSVFLKLDERGYVEKIAGSQNYIVKYGIVITKNPTSILVKYDDGSQQQLDITQETYIMQDRQLVSYTQVRPGQNVKLLVHQTDQSTSLKELSIERGNYNISNVYKANIYVYDAYNHVLILNGLKKLENGRWTLTTHKGDVEIPLEKDAALYNGNKEIRLDDINRYYADREAYIAVEKGLGGVEKGVLVTLRARDDYEKVYEDDIRSVTGGTGEIKMGHQYETARYTEGSIIIKDGKLVSGNSLSINDRAFVVTNRSNDTGIFEANIIQVQGRTEASDVVTVYRGRIDEIREGVSFTVESFSQFNGMRWQYFNTPKTFVLSGKTRILDESGVINNRQFNEYSPKNYIGKVVNIVARGAEVIMITEAPYAVYNIKGIAYLEYGSTINDILSLRKVSIYNRQNGKWESIDDAEFTLRQDTIVLKNEQLVSASEISRGDTIRVLKSNEGVTGEASIVLIEE